MHRLLMFTAAMVLANTCGLFAATASSADTSPAADARYTFSWPLRGDAADALQPRGGSTRGPAVALDDSESKAWKALQAPGLSDFERDRRAILAMAGSYRVSFDFLEIARFDGSQKPNAPYQSWGTEKIYVDIDSERFISLVHILEMRVIDSDGKVSEPFVTKHWRQDWHYQPTHIVEYAGNDRWQRRALTQVNNQWSQTVYQVDESPRYAGIGRWRHTAAFSSWISDDTWRPLPRREWSVRNDYQLLRGSNRHTVTAVGWLQEENNLKTVLTAHREIDAQRPYLAREYGVARYERIRDEGFAEADHYFERTRAFWDQVRGAWATAFQKYASITLRGPVDKLGLFEPLFAQADLLAENDDAAAEKNPAVIRAALGAMGVPE